MRRIIGKLLCWVGLHDPRRIQGRRYVDGKREPAKFKQRICWRQDCQRILTILLASTIWYGTAQAQTFPQPSPPQSALPWMEALND